MLPAGLIRCVIVWNAVPVLLEQASAEAVRAATRRCLPCRCGPRRARLRLSLWQATLKLSDGEAKLVPASCILRLLRA